MYFADILNFFIHQQRNLQHIQNNFLSPEGSMRMMIRSEQLKILGEYINGDLNKEEFYKKMDEKTQKLIRYYQGGIEI